MNGSPICCAMSALQKFDLLFDDPKPGMCLRRMTGSG
jgi:hypothetical protein